MLRNFADSGIRHLGIEPSANVAAVARKKGILTLGEFFDEALARRIVSEHGQADAFIGANVMCHIHGHPADMQAINSVAKAHNLRVIEDCAQAHGAAFRGVRVGSMGDLACFSFYPTKNLGALGDGGMIVTNDAALAERARLLREYGWAERYVSHIPGLNSRLDEVQAAVLRIKLRYLDADNAARARLAVIYSEILRNLPLGIPKCRPEDTHVYHFYVVRSSERDELQTFLKARGVGVLVHYPMPVHLQLAYRGRLCGQLGTGDTRDY